MRTAAVRRAGLVIGLVAVLAVLLAVPAGAHASTLLGRGTDATEATDHLGTTHVAWDVSHEHGYDTIDYCRIPPGRRGSPDVPHLTPQCSDGAIAMKGDRADANFNPRYTATEVNGDGPHLTVSPFGDVIIVTHGLCPYTWPA